MSSIPDLLRIGSIPSNLAMSVETGILDPVVQNDSFIRFNMKRAGFLHSNSKLVLSLAATGDDAGWEAANKHWTLPASVGIGSVIERVRLLSGNTVIQEIQDWGHLHAYRSQFISNENNKEREQFTTGRTVNMEYDYSDTVAARSDHKATGVGVGNGLEYKGTTAAGVYSENPAVWDKERHNCQYLEEAPVWQVSLQDLCPFLKSTQLPLFMFEEELFLEISFNKNQSRVVGNAEAIAGKAATEYLINTTESKLIIDYITYPNETMEAWANANQNLSFQYTDYELSKYTLASADRNTAFIRNQGGAGKVINKLILMLNRSANDSTTADGVGAATMLGAYGMVHPLQADATVQKKVVTNIRYNDEFLFPIDVGNDAYHFNNVLMSEGQPPMVSRQMYSGTGNALSGRLFESRAMDGPTTGLDGTLFSQSLKLNKNPRINQKGIELYQTYTNLEASDHTLRCWAEVMKVAQLVDGKLRSQYL